MAVDDAMLSLAAEAGQTLLRFYTWAPPCLSVGRNQRAFFERWVGAGLRPGIDIVRRPTGGGAVYHGPEVTYAFACPDRAWGGPRATGLRIAAALAAGLRGLGVRLDGPPPERRSGGGRRPGHGQRPDLPRDPCFAEAGSGEVTTGGRKIVGNAQRRRGGGILQHGSMLIRNEQGRATWNPESADAVLDEAVALIDLLGEKSAPAPDRLADALREGFVREFGSAAAPDAGQDHETREVAVAWPDLMKRATPLIARYATSGADQGTA